MNDADKKAFEEALLNRCKTIVTVPQDFDAGWQAACEWRDSQVGEPVFYARQDQLRKVKTNGPGLCAISAEPTQACLVALYTTPPASQINQALVDALQDLIDVQNGPPMAKYKQAWEDAMAKAGTALIAAKSGDV
jgi:hypothetical protein